ncbi:hypothetical protein C8Q70DRAFT_78359 [Cubamyces menziesii]|nr:hypothetical protein C8Q70DRAFT_78359 [Cubamyces menziesii]
MTARYRRARLLYLRSDDHQRFFLWLPTLSSVPSPAGLGAQITGTFWSPGLLRLQRDDT